MTIKDVRPALRTYLLASGPISTAVGGSRIYPIKMPQGVTLDSIVYTRVSGQGDHHMEGVSGLFRTRIQIDCYSLNPDSAPVLANLVKERIDGFRGLIGTVMIDGVFFDNERESYDDVTKLYGMSRDYFFWHQES